MQLHIVGCKGAIWFEIGVCFIPHKKQNCGLTNTVISGLPHVLIEFITRDEPCSINDAGHLSELSQGEIHR